MTTGHLARVPKGDSMYFKQFLHDDLGCSSYLIASRDSREAAVIDPQRDV